MNAKNTPPQLPIFTVYLYPSDTLDKHIGEQHADWRIKQNIRSVAIEADDQAQAVRYAKQMLAKPKAKSHVIKWRHSTLQQWENNVKAGINPLLKPFRIIRRSDLEHPEYTHSVGRDIDPRGNVARLKASTFGKGVIAVVASTLGIDESDLDNLLPIEIFRQYLLSVGVTFDAEHIARVLTAVMYQPPLDSDEIVIDLNAQSMSAPSKIKPSQKPIATGGLFDMTELTFMVPTQFAKFVTNNTNQGGKAVVLTVAPNTKQGNFWADLKWQLMKLQDGAQGD